MENKTQENLKLLSLVPIDVQEKKFQTLMLIYEKAMIQAKEELEGFKASLVNTLSCILKKPFFFNSFMKWLYSLISFFVVEGKSKNNTILINTL